MNPQKLALKRRLNQIDAMEHQQMRVRQRAGVTCELRFSPIYEASRSFAPHFHTEYQVIVAQHTVVEYRYRGASVLAAPHSLMLFAPGEVHAARAVDDLRFEAPLRTLFLSPSLVEQESGQDTFSSRLEAKGAGFEKGLILHRVWSETASSLQMEEALQIFLVHLRAEAGAKTEANRRGRERAGVRRAREYLCAHSTQEISLHTLARFAGLSPFHLCRVFAAEVGVPPHEFQLQLRVERARALILGGLTLREVALECGFVDQSHFCREWKKRVGVSPGRYFSLA